MKLMMHNFSDLYSYSYISYNLHSIFVYIYIWGGGGQCNTNWCYHKVLCTPTFFLICVYVQDQVQYNLQIFIIINANWCYSKEKCSALLLFSLFVCVCKIRCYTIYKSSLLKILLLHLIMII